MSRDAAVWREATVSSVRNLSPTVREITLQPQADRFAWRPGSHLPVQVRIDGCLAQRTYSLIGAPDARHCRIAVKRAEPGRGGSRFMWSLQAGEALTVGEPLNHFELALHAPETLLVAGGIGVTPLLGMAQSLAARAAPLRMLYAARSADEWVYRDELAAALGPRLRLLSSALGERIDFDAEIASLQAGAQLVVCGPLPMLDAARAAWQRAARPEALLRFETFGNSGAHPSEPFWVELPRHGLRLEVPASRTLLEVLEDAGIEMLASCRRGECGVCTLDIVSVAGRVDHRDVFFSAAQKRADRQLCACVSRITGGGAVLDTSLRPDT